MRVNIYYGGRGLIEDSTIYVINKLAEVLQELRVEVTRYNLFEEKNSISVLPNTLKDADGIILAVPVEWYGIGGLMPTFLDDCWLYGAKDKIASLYMLPVAVATSYGEKDAVFQLQKAWEMLGGIPLEGICAYVDNQSEFESNEDYCYIIEKRAEYFYRNINQHAKLLPGSTLAVKKSTLKTKRINLTPQENEQLSLYVSDDNYVRTQKEDIEELTQMFKGLLADGKQGDDFIPILRKRFHPVENVSLSYSIEFPERSEALIIDMNGKDLELYYGTKEDANIHARTSIHTFEKILRGEISFQNAFMGGELTAQGDFRILRSFDTLFPLT